MQGHHPEVEREGNSKGRGDLERELTCPDDVTQQQGEESLNQRALKDSKSLGSFIVNWSVFVWLADVGWSFMWYGNQAGSKWLYS